MANKPKKPATSEPESVPAFALGDRVEVRYFGPGRIIELRGPLGPGGAQVYRVAYRFKPRVAYLEVLGDQLRPAKAVKRRKPAAGGTGATADQRNGAGTASEA